MPKVSPLQPGRRFDERSLLVQLMDSNKVTRIDLSDGTHRYGAVKAVDEAGFFMIDGSLSIYNSAHVVGFSTLQPGWGGELSNPRARFWNRLRRKRSWIMGRTTGLMP